MSLVLEFWDKLLHIDRFLVPLVQDYPFWSYFILFFVIFAETAFIVTSFLPSDVVLFSACSLMMVQKSFNPFILIPLFVLAAILGDSCSFAIGRALRKKVNKTGKVFFIKTKSLEKTNRIFERSGGTSVLIARFIPLLRSLVPFVTGVSKKEYCWFLIRNIIGISIWATLYCTLGVLFGNLDFVKEHYGLVTIGVCVLTIITAIISLTLKKLIVEKKAKKKEKEVK